MPCRQRVWARPAALLQALSRCQTGGSVQPEPAPPFADASRAGHGGLLAACLLALLLAADAGAPTDVPSQCFDSTAVLCYAAFRGEHTNSFGGPDTPWWYDISGNGNDLAALNNDWQPAIMSQEPYQGSGVGFTTPTDRAGIRADYVPSPPCSPGTTRFNRR